MAMTHNPEDKFAFLFSGRTDSQSLKNLKEVYDLLTYNPDVTNPTGFCGYPSSNVKICIGGTDTNSVLADYPFSVVSDVAGFRAKFFEFATTVNARNTSPDGLSHPVNTVLLYFTGTADTSDPGNITFDVIDGPPVTSISQSQLRLTLRGFNPVNDPLNTRQNYLLNSYVHLVFDLDSAGGLDQFVTALDADHIGTKTYSCSSGETTENELLSGASKFTFFWCRAFRMVPFDDGAGINYADTMPTGYVEDNISDELVSVTQACEYAKLNWPASPPNPPAQNPFSNYVGTGPFYLGLPWLVIRDGTPNLWQSPDIKLYHPDSNPPYNELPDTAEENIDDYYKDDSAAVGTTGYIYKNHIHIYIRNFGTHPVVHLKTNFILYNTGCGGSGYSLPSAKDDDLRTSGSNFLIPHNNPFDPVISLPQDDISDSSVHYINGIEYNFDQVPFLTDTHRCIRAKTTLGINSEPDMTDWNFANVDSEAQRNINLAAVSSGGTGGKKAEKEIRDVFRKKFLIKNPFNKAYLFRVIYPPFPPLEDFIDISIYKTGVKNILVKPKRFGSIIYSEIRLKAGEEVEFYAEILKKMSLKVFDRIELPFEIMVAKRDIKPAIQERSRIRMPRFITLAGFTINLAVRDANLAVQVVDEKGNPAVNAPVMVVTAEGLQAARLMTDKNGLLRLEGINPSKYNIHVIGKSGKAINRIEIDLMRNLSKLMKINVRKSQLGLKK